MYTPAAFNELDVAKLQALIERYSFGLLISQHDGSPLATHLPLLLDRSAGPQGTLLGHMARANPQWQQAEGQTVLAVFSGPHAYISPTWYAATDVVPTWNYVAVHVYATFRAIHDDPTLRQIVQDMVKAYEATMPTPWTFKADSDFIENMLKGIVGFRLEIARIEGKLKLSQNQPQERQEKVVRHLSASGDQNAQEVAALMAAAPREQR